MSHYNERNDYLVGEYWIDPNEGDSRDAILVHCDAERRATCVLADPSRSPIVEYVGNEQEVWLSEIDGAIKVQRFFASLDKYISA